MTDILIVFILVIGSDSRIFMQQLRHLDDGEGTSSIGQFVALMSYLNLEKPVSVVGIGCDYMAVYGCCSGQEGANVILYNTKFRVVQTKQFFKTYFSNSRLWVIGKDIFLGLGQMISVIPFRISKEQLCDMIGAQKFQDFSNYVDKEYINEECELEDGLYFDEDHQAQVNSIESKRIVYPLHRREKVVLNDLPDYYPDVEEVDKMIAGLEDMDIVVDMVRAKNVPADSIQAKFYSNPDGLLIMSDEFELFCNELERCGSSEMEITEHLIPLLIETNHVHDLMVCLKKYNNVSEKMLVKSINYCLDAIEGHQSEDLTVLHNLLNHLLSCTYSPEIFHHIRAHINTTKTIYLFRHLLRLLKVDDEIGGILDRPSTTGSFNSDLIVFEWMITLIDAQYQKLILSSDTEIYSLLVEILNFVQQTIDEGKATNSLLANLYKLLKRKDQATNEVKYSKWYSVEEVKLY